MVAEINSGKPNRKFVCEKEERPMTEIATVGISDLLERFQRVVKEDAETLSDELLGSRNARRISQRLFFLRQEFFRRMGGNGRENQKLLADLEKAIPGWLERHAGLSSVYAYFFAKKCVLDCMKETQKKQTG